MQTYRLVLAYDGADFSGWQRQPERRTVQGELERALAVIARAPVRVQGAGRTDAGVHALGQCASFALEEELNARRLFASLRGLLPEDITPLKLHPCPEEFNARFNASARHYLYRMSKTPCAPLRRLRWDLPFLVELEPMRAALPALREAVDWRGFCTQQAAEKGSICHILRLDLEPEGEEIRLRLGADRFLHNMVRIIVGTLVEIGRGRWEPERAGRILATGDRTLAGPTAPAQGLFLERVEYPAQFLTRYSPEES